MSAWVEAPEFSTVTVQQDGKDVPIKDVPFFKDTPDIGTALRRSYEAHREVGARIPIKVDKTKPEAVETWRKEHLGKLYDAGVLSAPPKAVEEYEIKKPDDVDEKLWSADHAKKLGEVLLKHGVPKSAVPELLALHNERVAGVNQTLKATYEEGVASLKTEWGARYDEVMEKCKRFTPAIFKTPEEVAFFEETGLGNHPLFLGPLSRLADRAGNDTSIIPNAGAAGGGMTREEVFAEVADIMNNQNNKWYKLYRSGDKAANDYVDSLYKKIEGADKQVVIP